MDRPVTIAHLSDVHLSPITGFDVRHRNVKRVLGYLNWQRKRQFIHRRSIADRIVADLRSQGANHIALTGDLINLGLPLEYAAATEWLQSVGPASEVSVVPGNHDIYSTIGRDPGVARWAAHMASDAWGAVRGAAPAGGFPYVRRVGPVAIIGICSAVETPPGKATGRLGTQQITAIRRCLDKLATEPVFRLLMIHHPPLPGLTRLHHELTDAAPFEAMLRNTGAELVLHGHTHLASHTVLNGGKAATHIVGVASASAGTVHGAEPLAQYNLLRIGGTKGAWKIELRRRGIRDANAAIVDLQHRVLL